MAKKKTVKKQTIFNNLRTFKLFCIKYMDNEDKNRKNFWQRKKFN